ncbi:hypothetical protein CKA32_002285 [Geitlerinema sp. FC II]|nr:hypothetical protein CKA32_002285 [Geitlerinema sp. FC II]
MQEIAEILTGKEFLLNGIKSPLKSRNAFPDIGYKHLPYTPRSEEPPCICRIWIAACDVLDWLTAEISVAEIIGSSSVVLIKKHK